MVYLNLAAKIIFISIRKITCKKNVNVLLKAIYVI